MYVCGLLCTSSKISDLLVLSPYSVTRVIKQDIFSKQEIIKRIVSLDAIFILRRGSNEVKYFRRI